MVYVLDTSSFRVLGHYFPDHFPTVWNRIDLLVSENKLISVREVFEELKNAGNRQFILDWAENNRGIFLRPTQQEALFISKIFSVQKFQELVTVKARGRATPVADPFIIACAKIKNGCVITEEAFKPNSGKIPNVCEHFGIDCTNIEGLMKKERWQF